MNEKIIYTLKNKKTKQGEFMNFKNESFLRLPEVIKVTGLKRAIIYELMRSKKFPQSINLTERAVAWVESEIQQWIINKIETSRSNPKNKIKIGLKIK